MMKIFATAGLVHGEIAAPELAARLERPDEVIWIDIANPKPADIEFLRREFGFHELALEDATKRQQRPKLDEYGDFSLLVVYTVALSARQLINHQVTMFLGRNYLVTLHNGTISEVDETVRRWRQTPGLAAQGVGELLYVLLDSIVDQYFPVADALSDRVDEIEESIFRQTAPNVRTAIGEIFTARKEILQFRRLLGPERDVLNALLRRETWRQHESLLVYYQDVYDHILRIIDQLDTMRDLLSSALDASLASTSNQLNVTMRRLTTWTIILMSVTLVAGIYGMNFDVMPELRWQYGYLVAIGLMFAIGVLLYVYFKHEDWI